MSTIDKVVIATAKKLHAEHRSDNWQSGGLFPSVDKLTEAVKLLSEVIFPEYLLENLGEMANHQIVINLEKIYYIMEKQISYAMKSHSEDIATKFIESIPKIKSLLTTDVEAIYKADPAASTYAEIVLCYPTVVAMTHHRIAHSLYELGVPIIPRIISEMAHSKTGIDIHPGATIGRYFAIDHGTGVVIGETTIIGEGVVIYQGVTLGAKGFRFDENGEAINIPRHPIIEDNVRIYSNSSILGRITIGHDSVIGGNMWIDNDIAPFSKMIKLR